MHIQWSDRAEFILGRIFGPNFQIEKLKEQIDEQLLKIQTSGISFPSEKSISSRPKGRREAPMNISGKSLIVEYVKNESILSVQMIELA